MPSLLPFLQLRNPDDGTCVELANNCRTLAYIDELQRGQWRLSECDDCCPDCIDSQDGYLRPSIDQTYWASGNTDPAADEYLGIFVHSLWLEPARSVRRVGETLQETQAFSPRRLELVGEMVTDSVRGAALAWSSITDVLTSCGSAGWNVDIRQFCPDVNEPSTVDLDALALSTFSEPSVPIETREHDCDPCRRIDPSVWQATPLPAEDEVNTFASTVVDSGGRSLLRARVVSVDEDPDGSQIPDCEGVPIKIVFEVFSDASYGKPIPLPCFVNPLRKAVSAVGSVELTCIDDDEAVPAGAVELTCIDEATVTPGGGLVVAECQDDIDRPPAECRPFDWLDACVQVGSVDSCTTLDDTSGGVDIRQPATTIGDYCTPMWRRPVSCLIPRLPSPTSGVLVLEVDAGASEMRNVKFELWPAFDNVEDPATCTGEAHYRRIVPCETWEISRIEQSSTLTIDGQTSAIDISCLGQPSVPADSLVSGRNGGGIRHPVISPDCRWWLVATLDCDHLADDYDIRAYFVPRYPN